jgi:hypothetical protein
MHFGIPATSVHMQRESIEEIIARELGSLYPATLQGDDSYPNEGVPSGLCKICDRADKCLLKERKSGTWHCKDFE